MNRNTAPSSTLSRARRFAVALAVATLVGAVAMVFYWRSESRAALEDPAAVAAALEAQGWRTTFGAASVAGAPSRIDLTIDGVAFGKGDWGWRSAQAVVRRMIYRRDFLSVVARGPHGLETPLGRAAFESPAPIQASLIFGANGMAGDALARLSLVAEALEGRLTAPHGAARAFVAARAELYLRPARDERERRLFARLRDVTVDRGGPAFEAVALEGLARFASALSRRLEDGAPRVTEIAVRRLGASAADTSPGGLVLIWKDGARIAFDGALRFGADGAASGRLVFEARDAPAVADRLAALGVLGAGDAAAARAAATPDGALAGALVIEGGSARLELR